MLRFLKPSLGKAMFGAGVFLACITSPVVLAHEMHAAASQSAALAADESSFLKENEAAMTKMMNDMEVKPTGDVDKDFVAMMVPHHQGAIDMAVLELRYGKNEQLRRLAQEIIVSQMQEIAAMKLAIGEPAPASLPAPTQSAPAANKHHGAHMHMHMDTPTSVNK
jgi:hypothetical protein